MKLSAERVWLTNPQRKKIAEAIKEKRNLKLKLRPEQMVGEYPLFVTPNVKSKMQKARILGKGCTCELQAEAMERTRKAGKGLYDEENDGKGMFMFGKTGKGKRRSAPAAVTGKVVASKATYEEPLEQPAEKTVGSGLYQLGTGLRRHSYGSVPYNFPTTFN